MRETGIKKLEGNDKKILEKYEILLIEIRIYCCDAPNANTI